MKSIKKRKEILLNTTILICMVIFSMILPFSLFSQKNNTVKLLRADSLLVDKKIDPDLKKLIGNVELQHDSAYMYCDSAYLYQIKNDFVAYGNVLIAQGDTLFIYGDSLNYTGNTSSGIMYGNVRLMDGTMTLSTNYLYFNNETNISNYRNGGTIIDSINNLSSNIGTYYSDLHEFHFQDSVVLHNPDYDIYCDTLNYNTEIEKSFFIGPTKIIGDSFNIYCEDGWYDSFNDISQYGKNTIFKSKENTLWCDSLYYERKTEIGIAMNNITLHDTVQQIILKGNYSYFNQKEDFSRITDSAQFIQYDAGDTLYLHADTLINTVDSTGNNKVILAWNHVKFFRTDMQGKCDSLVYSTNDSLTKLYRKPVLWNEGSQLTAEFMQIYSKDNKANRIDMQRSAFIITEEDSTMYNQISGKNMIGFIRNNELHKIHVNGNAQSIYFPKDGDKVSGTNKSEASNMVITFSDGKASKVKLITSAKGIMKPLDQATKDDKVLKGFIWLEKDRPKNKYDIFVW